jgi:hypothetical protein
MKMLCTRTSEWHDKSPCEEAELYSYVYVDRRATDDPDQLSGGRDFWFARGRNHRVENGHLARDLHDVNEWTVDIESLEDLLNFCSKHGELVIKEDTSDVGPVFAMEIYDDYRE